jgi:hypothetical protein
VTTARFLEIFALGSLRDLPELDTLDDARAEEAEDVEAALDDAFGLNEEEADDIHDEATDADVRRREAVNG